MCGCLTAAFVERARNNMSQLLKDSKSADEFKVKLTHFPDIHTMSTSGMGESATFTGTLYHARNRGSKVEQYIHSVLKKGNSNLLEASHNIFIRFREKALNLERAHYEMSTNLAPLQANLTYMSKKHGSTYTGYQNYINRCSGLADKLQLYSENRTKDRQTEKIKKRRIQLKCERVRKAQTRKEWSAKRGNFEYFGAEEATV